MVQSVFGTGNLWATPAGANPTPVRFGTLQDVGVDFSFDFKMLYGGFQFPVEQARGKGKIDIKATIGRVDPIMFNQVYFGMTPTAGETLSSVDETSAIPTTPFQITVANGATFSRDLGVFDANTGKWLTRVATAPATGQYSVVIATGVYTFAAADVAHVVRISYTYGAVATGSTFTLTNQLLGSGPVFSLQLVNIFKGKSLFMNFPAVQSSKLAMPLKLDDFSLPNFDMSAQDDGAGNLFTMSMTG
jgi:hypothetical protein